MWAPKVLVSRGPKGDHEFVHAAPVQEGIDFPLNFVEVSVKLLVGNDPARVSACGIDVAVERERGRVNEFAHVVLPGTKRSFRLPTVYTESVSSPLLVLSAEFV